MKFIFLALTLVISINTFAAKTYQVTGSVVEVTETKIVIDKKGEKFEMDRGASTKVTGELKVGAKVTATYMMTAASIEAKEEKKKK